VLPCGQLVSILFYNMVQLVQSGYWCEISQTGSRRITSRLTWCGGLYSCITENSCFRFSGVAVMQYMDILFFHIVDLSHSAVP
jgi:hypothetical protein